MIDEAIRDNFFWNETGSKTKKDIADFFACYKKYFRKRA
jgi:hypothetical protein